MPTSCRRRPGGAAGRDPTGQPARRPTSRRSGLGRAVRTAAAGPARRAPGERRAPARPRSRATAPQCAQVPRWPPTCPPPGQPIGKSHLTCDHLVTYYQAMDEVFKALADPTRREPARRAPRARRADAELARVPAADDPLRGDEAPAGPGGGESRDHAAPWPREAALPQPRPDQAHPRPLGEQIRRALGRRAQRAQAKLEEQ